MTQMLKPLEPIELKIGMDVACWDAKNTAVVQDTIVLIDPDSDIIQLKNKRMFMGTEVYSPEHASTLAAYIREEQKALKEKEANPPPPPQAQNTTPTVKKPPAPRPEGGAETKFQRAEKLFIAYRNLPRKTMIEKMVADVGLTAAGASTYYAALNKKHKD